MNFSSNDPFLSMNFDSILGNNFNSSDYDFLSDYDDPLDSNLLEDFLFNDENVDKTYPDLNEDISNVILSSSKITKKHPELYKIKDPESSFLIFIKHKASHLKYHPFLSIPARRSERTNFIQCTHCDDVFTSDAFELHVCKYDESNTLIEEFVQEHPVESDFEKVQRHTNLVMDQNRNMLEKILQGFSSFTAGQFKDDQAKQSNHECFICKRKFVHESGLHRHYDKHIGEIIPQSELTNALHSVTLCIFCGEIFTTEQKVWKHLLNNHMSLNEENLRQVFSCSEFRQCNKDNNCEPPPSKKMKSEDDETVPVPNQHVPVKDFVRMIYVAKLYHCEFCDSVFANEKSLLHHISKHEPSCYFSCQTCDLKMLSFKDILIHRHEECWNYRDYRDSLKDIPCAWICNVCDEMFAGIEQLILHR